MPRETGHERHRNAGRDESSSDDEQQSEQTKTTVPEVTPTPPAPTRARPPAAAAVTAPRMPLHTDPAAAEPEAEAEAAAPAATDAAENHGEDEGDDVEEEVDNDEEDEEDEEDADEKSEEVVDEAALAALNALAAEMEAIDYNTLTYASLLDIMARASRPAIEEMMAQRDQQVESNVLQLQNQRVERFLDVAASSAAAAAAANADGAGEEEVAATDGYSYNVMLSRLFEALNRNNEGSSITERNQLPVPILERMGKKKTVIANFGRICAAFHRPMEDVKDFIEKELSIRGNLDSNDALILKFEIRRQTDLDRVLFKYLDEYAKCNSCHRIDTTLTKDGRRLELRCNVCTATRTVTAAGTATFSAQIEKRSRQRAAMTL